MRRMMLMAGVVALALVAAACGDDSDSSSATSGAAATTAAAVATTAAAPATTAAAPEPRATEVDLTAADYSYTGVPESIPAGLVTVSIDNTGAEEHQATIIRLNDDVTLQQALGAFATDEREGLKLITVHGGPNGVAPGGSQATTQELEPGNYVFACFIPSADGIPHAAKGMLQPFTVTEPAGDTTAAPATDGQIITDDFKYTIPPTFNGKGTFEVFNAAEQPHEMTVYKVAEGKTLADVQAFFTSTEPPTAPPPITGAGGSAAASPGTSIIVPLDLDPGNYVMACFIADKESGQPHIALGMIQPFTVS